MVEVIWPLSVPSSRCESASGRGVLPLRTFIQETLRRSRTSYSTLQVALYYLILIKAHVPKHDFTMEQPEDVASLRALQCGRRMFLAALILASKYLQDRNYSARAWSKISGLKVCEINTNEMAFLAAVNWKLHITDPVWERWQDVVFRHTPSNPPASPGAAMPNTWKAIMPLLNPELDSVVVAPKTPVTPSTQEFKPQLSPYPLRSPLPLSDGFGSQESTPTPSHYKVPRFLEPKPDLLPPTPSLARLGPLPTPALTPQSTVSTTPAASAMTFGSRRPSMCSAMAQAQSSSLARSCIDQFNPSIKNGLDAYHFPSRRPSLAPSTTSSASSPESMITDTSRSSRASSISSISSANWAPNQARLARLATCRNARLPYPALSKCKEQLEYAPSEPMSSPDLESFHIDDAEATPMRVDSPMSMAQSRKRGRSSIDLQQNVRHLLHSSRSTSFLRSNTTVLPDRSVARSFLLPKDRSSSYTEAKGLQSPKHTVPECRLPIQKDLGRKRTCCGSEAASTFRREGPGMWEGVL
jgi:PHO85 cyclin-5